MKCIVCKGSDIEPKSVDEQIRKGRDIKSSALRQKAMAGKGG